MSSALFKTHILKNMSNAVADGGSGSERQVNDTEGNAKAVCRLACNQLTIQPGDYIMWTFGVYDPEAGFGAEPLPTGFDAPFEVGEDETEYVVDGSSGWTMGTVNVKITANGITLDAQVMLTIDATRIAFADVNKTETFVIDPLGIETTLFGNVWRRICCRLRI